MRDASASESRAFAFGHDGFVEPFRLFTADDCRVLACHFRQAQYPPQATWLKSTAIIDRFVCNLATHPRLLSLLAKLIGENIVLWGSSFIVREAARIHPWHTDIESSAPHGRFASVWIGLENTCRESALQLIAGSHAFGKTLQQVQHERGVRRGLASNDMVAVWARDLDANARLVQPDMTDGDALVFDGRLWHAGPNGRRHGTRTALLLQYAAAETSVPVPDFTQLEWPFRFKGTRAPVILVRGEARKDVNELVRLPPMITTQVYHLALPLADDPQRRWKPYRIFNGATPIVEELSCHASVLSPGFTPHPPHSHEEEELLIALQGEADLLISNGPSSDYARTKRLIPRSFIYYSAGQYHTIRNSGVSPITYLMFKWRGDALTGGTPAGTRMFHFGNVPTENSKSFQAYPIVEQSTAYLGKLHAHLTTMQPGAGYAPHIDDYDVAIVVLSGKVETLGQIVYPHGVIYYSAGQPHGLRNVGSDPAQYLVFEFHAQKMSSSTRRPPKRKTVRQHVADILSRLGLLETARRARNMFRQPK
jgi:quercetin dioxygenase-like cupin family protein